MSMSDAEKSTVLNFQQTAGFVKTFFFRDSSGDCGLVLREKRHEPAAGALEPEPAAASDKNRIGRQFQRALPPMRI